jgi:xanthine dehydrogenase accessory factor
MSFDLDALRAAVAAHDRVARVVVAEAKGSAPREAGASMLVWEDGQSGTIGGGALEWEAAARAREMLARGGAKLDRLALGPALQQCCGGAVTLLTEVWDEAGLAALAPEAGLVARAVEKSSQLPLAVKRRLQAARGEGVTGGPALIQGWIVEPLDRPRQQLWVWGAGHVGRAVVGVLAPMPELAITWIDTAESRFPEAVPEGVEKIVAADPIALVRFAPEGAEHLILTYSHALDLALCNALLGHGFARAGLIGSATKWARFRKRLSELGHGSQEIARIDCPIGDPRFGKHPQAIAISVAAAILARKGATTSAKEGAG